MIDHITEHQMTSPGQVIDTKLNSTPREFSPTYTCNNLASTSSHFVIPSELPMAQNEAGTDDA